MFKCTGNCQACGRCKNIFPNQVEKNMIFPVGFLGKHQIDTDGCLSREDGSFYNDQFGIAFDIGTTTVAAALWNLNTNKKIDTIGGVNPQRNFGADVLSRISFCLGSRENHELLRYPLMKTFEKMVLSLVNANDISLEQVVKCVFCGNTTMTLLFAGLSVDGLAQYPFSPEKTEEMSFDFYVSDYKMPAIIMAGISGHIGGDITAAMLASGMDQLDENSILLDLGTNGEVICKIDNKLYGFSTAAGPAFEGANISCGMAATVGAIDEFYMSDSSCNCHVIGQSKTMLSDNLNEKPPQILGICGTGLMSAIEQMLSQKIINIHGDLCSWDDYKRFFPYNKIGENIGEQKFIIVNQTSQQPEISISQDDIRQLQMAKAAILAGLKLLFKQIHCDPDSISTVYLAGGFSKIKTSTLTSLNIFPFDVTGKLKCIGNGALTGASMVLLADDIMTKSRMFSHQVNRIELGSSSDFQNEFLGSFDFKA